MNQTELASLSFEQRLALMQARTLPLEYDADEQQIKSQLLLVNGAATATATAAGAAPQHTDASQAAVTHTPDTLGANTATVTSRGLPAAATATAAKRRHDSSTPAAGKQPSAPPHGLEPLKVDFKPDVQVDKHKPNFLHVCRTITQ